MLIPFFIFLLGLCVGSFLNVVIYRHNTGVSALKGRSKCNSCGKTLAWYELIPFVSYVVQMARCRGCRGALSFQYPAAELLTGILFVVLFYRVPLSITLSTSAALVFLYGAFEWCVLIVICFYDLRHKIIPDAFVFTFALVALVGSLIQRPDIITVLAGPAVALPLFAIWLISRGRWMGFGDVKLAVGIGWFLGMGGGLAALVLAFWIGAVVGVVILALSHSKVTMKSEIPFAPFLIAGIAVVFFKHVALGDIFNLFNLIS